MKVYTYATHSQGLFDDLKNNEFVEVKVVGFGSKWNGFMDKFSGINNALIEDDVNDDEIVIFLDGFDSRIRLDPKIALERYERMFPTHPVLISQENILFSAPILKDIEGYAKYKVFKGEANSGMYMGPAKKVRQMLSECLNTNESDDQRSVNIVMNNNKYIVKDTDRVIFENLIYSKRGSNCTSDETNAVFVSCPAEISLRRWLRGFFEYIGYLWMELLIITIILIMFGSYLKDSFRYHKKNEKDTLRHR